MALFGGAVLLSNLYEDGTTNPSYKIFYGNTFIDNFGYFSGGAVYAMQYMQEGSLGCSGIHFEGGEARGNFGLTYADGGGIALICDDSIPKETVTVDQSGFAKEAVTLTHPETGTQVATVSYNPLEIKLISINFDSNFVGQRGSALTVKNFR